MKMMMIMTMTMIMAIMMKLMMLLVGMILMTLKLNYKLEVDNLGTSELNFGRLLFSLLGRSTQFDLFEKSS